MGLDGVSPKVHLTWATYLNGSVVGSGTAAVARGSVVGFSNAAGFDELRVIATNGNATPQFGDYQAIALDNLSAQLAGFLPSPSRPRSPCLVWEPAPWRCGVGSASSRSPSAH